MNRAAEIILVIVIAGSALAFGGVLPWTYTAMELGVFTALLLLCLRQTWRGRIKLWVPLASLLFVLWTAFELLPLPFPWIARLEPARFAGPSVAALGALRSGWMTLSIDAAATRTAWLKFLLYLGGFVLAAALFDSQKRQSLVVKGLIGLGVFEAAYGIFQYLTGLHKIFWYTNPEYPFDATGTYINHNHFAGVIELTVPFMVAMIFYSFESWVETRRLGVSRQAAARKTSATFRLLFYVVLVAVALVAVILSRSRAGITSAFFTVVFIGLLAQLKTRRKAWVVGLFAFLALAVGYGVWIGLGPVLSRFEMIQGAHYLEEEGRLQFWRDTLRLIGAYPWTGTGLGTFALAFRHYQTSWLTYVVDHPHNDYLEFAAETGWPGAALLFVPILYLLVRMMVSFLSDARRYRPAVTLGCIGSVLALLLHSAADFNLHVPANALIYAVVLGIGYKAASVERREERRAAAAPQRPAAVRPLAKPLAH